MMRTIGLSVLLAFLVLIVLPIMALRVLGTQVVPEDPFDYPLESVVMPEDGQMYLADDGSFSLATAPAWADPIVEPNPVTGRDSTLWFLPDYSSADFGTNVYVTSSVVPPGTTLEALSQAEVRSARAELDSVVNVQERTRNVGGVLIRELSFTGSIDGFDLAWYAVIHKDGELVSLATVTMRSVDGADVRAETEPYLLTLRATN